ncbi:uncharacterized protein [Phaseolus vulgaris]|uniref:uncharacterized protein n=1 Tax=Phaseolus vulgaris TaxID=3885 RepID=UPI0035C962BA
MSDLLDLASGDQEINITVLQLWMMYLSGLCFDEGKHNIYGFLDPQITQSIGNKKSETQTYITTALKNGGKHIYFAPYIHERHWQLLIISVQDHTAAWFCSLHKKPPAYFKNIIDSAYSGYNMLCGRRTSNAQKLTWMYLKSNRQPQNYECGYYVMQWMLTILQAEIMKGWDKVIPQYNKHFKI